MKRYRVCFINNNGNTVTKDFVTKQEAVNFAMKLEYSSTIYDLFYGLLLTRFTGKLA